MNIGLGLAIIGIWVLPTAALFAPQVSGAGLFLSIFAAIIGTLIVCGGFK